MPESICVAVQGTVSIETEEYRDLVRSQTLLEVIFEVAKNEKLSYSTADVVKAVSRLANPVITAREPRSGAPEVETNA